jgi:hypothetical protein
MTTETVDNLVISEGKESVWSYHLSQIGQTESLCGYRDVIPTSMGVELWDSIATVHEDPCRACDVRAFGWPAPLAAVPNHPLYVACRVLDLYGSWKEAAHLVEGIDKGKDPLSLSAALDVLLVSVRYGPVAGINRSSELWNMISKGAGPNLGVEEQKALRKIFIDFVLHWR